jgi:C-terminal processing protease CtpA/Prc
MSLDEVAFASAASRGERKRKVGLGMVLNEFDGGQGLTIKKVKRGNASDLSGKVQAGDRLLSVDGTSLDGLKRDEIEKLVMRAVGSTSVCVLRRRDNSLDHVMLLRPEPALQAEKDAHEVAEEEEEGEDEPQKLVGLGMVFLRPDNKGGCVIKRLKEGSTADTHSDVVPGDCCLSIDGKPIENMTDRELSDSNRGWLGSTAVVVLRSKGGVLKTCELKRRTQVFDSIVEGCGRELSYDSSIASGLTTSDTTGRCGLGLTFHEWNSVGGGLRVKRVKKGGVADNSGRIHPGDIVQATGKSQRPGHAPYPHQRAVR